VEVLRHRKASGREGSFSTCSGRSRPRYHNERGGITQTNDLDACSDDDLSKLTRGPGNGTPTGKTLSRSQQDGSSTKGIALTRMRPEEE